MLMHNKRISQILSICSQGIERKRNSDVNQGPNSVKILRKKTGNKQKKKKKKKMTGNNPKLDLVNVDMHTNVGQILSIGPQDIERKRYSDVNQGP